MMLRVLAAASIFTVAAAPAFAGTVQVPEPTTIGVFAVGAASVFLVRKVMRRK